MSKATVVAVLAGFASAAHADATLTQEQARKMVLGPYTPLLASTVLAAYDRNQFAVEQAFRDNQVLLIGIVRTVERDPYGHPAITLQTNDDPEELSCTMPESATGDLAKLEVGQLVAVRVAGGKGDGPIGLVLKGAGIAWTGIAPSSRASEDDLARAATIEARSGEHCIADGGIKIGGGDKEMLANEHRMLDESARDLAQLGVPVPSCPLHPLSVLGLLCRSQSLASECNTTDVDWLRREAMTLEDGQDAPAATMPAQSVADDADVNAALVLMDKAAAFSDADKGDCNKMTADIGRLADASKGLIAKLTKENVALSPDQQMKLSSSATKIMTSAVQACGKDPKMQNVINELMGK